MSLPVLVTVTDLARQHFADMLVNGRSFIVETFVLGSGGADPSNPTIALTPDPSLPTLPQQFFGPKAISGAVLISPTCPAFNCTVAQLEAVGSLSNVGLNARINYSPIANDPLLNTVFLFAVGNFPLSVKTDAEQLVIQLQVQF